MNLYFGRHVAEDTLNDIIFMCDIGSYRLLSNFHRPGNNIKDIEHPSIDRNLNLRKTELYQLPGF